MTKNISIKKANIRGKRPNLSAQNSVTDGILSVLSLPPERMPLPPLSPLHPTAPSPQRKHNPRGNAVASVVLLALPFLYTAVFFVHGAMTSHPLPPTMFPMLVLIARFPSNIGGLTLYLAARAENRLRKTVGLLALAAFLLPIFGVISLGNPIAAMDPSNLTSVADQIALFCFALAFACMIALCLFSIPILVRAFHPQSESIDR